jgi:hypothetical protein
MITEPNLNSHSLCEVLFHNLRKSFSIKLVTDTWNARICGTVMNDLMCNSILEHYGSCNHEEKMYLYYFMGTVTCAVTWNFLLVRKLKMLCVLKWT